MSKEKRSFDYCLKCWEKYIEGKDYLNMDIGVLMTPENLMGFSIASKIKDKDESFIMNSCPGIETECPYQLEHTLLQTKKKSNIRWQIKI